MASKPTPTAPEPNPFDVAAMRAAPPTEPIAETVYLTVSCRAPSRVEFFRVHPGEDNVLDGTVLEYESPDGARDTFFVLPRARVLVPEATTPVRFFLCINRNGGLFVWPAKIPSDQAGSSGGRTWHESGLQVADMARTRWVKRVSSMPDKSYRAVVASGDLGEPRWPDLTLSQALEMAFRDRVIADADHHVIRALLGEI